MHQWDSKSRSKTRAKDKKKEAPNVKRRTEKGALFSRAADVESQMGGKMKEKRRLNGAGRRRLRLFLRKKRAAGIKKKKD